MTKETKNMTQNMTKKITETYCAKCGVETNPTDVWTRADGSEWCENCVSIDPQPTQPEMFFDTEYPTVIPNGYMVVSINEKNEHGHIVGNVEYGMAPEGTDMLDIAVAYNEMVSSEETPWGPSDWLVQRVTEAE